jgi:alpha,alpha-trehalose phosphorylase
MCLVNGFAGMRAYEDILSFNPHIPEQWEEYSFKVTYRGRLIEVRVDRENITYTLLEGENINILHNGEIKQLKK